MTHASPEDMERRATRLEYEASSYTAANMDQTAASKRGRAANLRTLAREAREFHTKHGRAAHV